MEKTLLKMAPGHAHSACFPFCKNSPETGLMGTALHQLILCFPSFVAFTVNLPAHLKGRTATRSRLLWSAPAGAMVGRNH